MYKCPKCGDTDSHFYRDVWQASAIQVFEKATGGDYYERVSASEGGEWFCGACDEWIDIHPEETWVDEPGES
jgi:hypothetical protein